MHANPPQLHSNLLYVQRYRRESKLIGEAAYFFINILSAESFISNIDAKSLSMDEAEFEKNLESARARISGLSSQPTAPPPLCDDQDRSSDSVSGTSDIVNANSEIPMKKVESVSDLEDKGAAMLLKDTKANKISQEYPYLFANADVRETYRSVDDLVRALQGEGEAVVDKVLDVKQEEYTAVLAEEQT
ncbi:hypothetical protein Bca52824_065875 [Brassica carinata]|uniref:VPS9 domain-containing protein n=1 Tax=Brassica carinata TaxID=52824 RepID=A0A8X7U9J7_BRACI|nr:hypothetical protein Bca52824_065875 [Brassica carinata]